MTECRYCRRKLEGKPYEFGGSAYFLWRGKRHEAKKNWYGGFVCSRRCDEKVCLDLEESMPGAGPATRVSDFARRQIESNWSDEE